MATTTTTGGSMHKPGWRSRRRSRLSLVERAVPRLGRMPEEGSKTARDKREEKADIPPYPSKSKLDIDAGIEAKSPSHGDAGPAKVQDQPPHRQDDISETAVPSAPTAAAEHGLHDASAQLRNDEDKSVSSEIAAIGDDGTKAAEGAGTPVPSPATQPFATVKTGMPSPEADNRPSTQALSDHKARQAGFSRSQLPASGMGPAATALVRGLETGAGAEADRENAVQSDERAPSAGPRLELDWDRLIDSGFTDPRDRSRPLPKRMDEIIRALIRQALSDQSSWRDRVILVTSPYQRTGKTTAAINFAFGLTTVASHHAVLVDVDTAGPGAVERLGGDGSTGITAALADESIAFDEMVIKTDLERLTLVASGAADDETLDRFASRRMLQILRHLTENPDTILIIDAPPILLSQEAAVLSVIAGQVVLAVDAGRTTADQIEHALQRIGERHNVSLVLNECSGVIGEDAPKAASRPERPVPVKRRTPDVKRRLPKAAAAGAFVLSLLVLPEAGQTGPDDAFSMPPAALSTRSVLPPERWSPDIGTDAVHFHCRRMCR